MHFLHEDRLCVHHSNSYNQAAAAAAEYYGGCVTNLGGKCTPSAMMKIDSLAEIHEALDHRGVGSEYFFAHRQFKKALKKGSTVSW